MKMSRGDMFKSRLAGELFMLNKSTLNALTTIGDVDMIETAKNEVLYDEFANVAVISIDGGLSKKTEHGLCMSVYGYDTIAQHLSVAEANSKIDTVVFRVDTPGGHVSGADDLEDRIYKSPLKTITMYENLGASAGIYVFSASDEIYATKTTELGSIGVLATIPISQDEPTHLAVVSSNAENKVCDMDNGCFESLQVKLDTHESMFLATVSKNTGLSRDTIISGFNNGDTIFAKDALELGFLNGITTFHELMGSTIPTATSKNLANTRQRNNMEVNEENFNAIVEENTVFKAANHTLSARNTNLQVELDDALAINAVAVETAETVKADMHTRLLEAKAQNVSIDTVMDMINATTAEDSSKIALNAEKIGMISGMDDGEEQLSAIQAKAQKFFKKGN